ncbi:MAG: 8-oxo-dGTP diphosphatase [Halodesulfurarchaeum sp.]
MQEATLCFPVRAGSILLIEKKRGLGAGMIHGPGGKLEPGETPREAGRREVGEEIEARPVGLDKIGELEFVMDDGPWMFVHVFRSDGLEGDPGETDEAVPRWYPVSEIPLDRMWPDDRYWLPLLIERRTFRGFFVFDGGAERLGRWELETDVDVE